MDHIKQSKNNNCGQTCLQMLTKKSLEEVEIAVGKKGSTFGKDLIRGLNTLGYYATSKTLRVVSDFEKFLRSSKEVHGVYVFCVTFPKNRKHWVVLQGGHFYDPAMNDKMRIKSYFKRLHKFEARLTSYISAGPIAEICDSLSAFVQECEKGDLWQGPL